MHKDQSQNCKNNSLRDRTFIVYATQRIIATQQWANFWFPFPDLINSKSVNFQEMFQKL